MSKAMSTTSATATVIRRILESLNLLMESKCYTVEIMEVLKTPDIYSESRI
jgi:hypothetical protein